MHADGVDVLHAAHGDHVARRIAHRFKFDLFPAVDVALHQDLRDRRCVQPGLGRLAQRGGIVRRAAARAAQRERRAHDDRITDPVCRRQRLVYGMCDGRRHGGLPDLCHGLLEQLAVLRAVDGRGVRPQQAHAVRLQKAVRRQLHGQRQPRLPAQSGQQAVRLFLDDDAAQCGGVQRLQIDLVRQSPIGHDRGGVRVDQNDVDAGLLQHAARLRTGIVELGRLPDHDRAGADDQHFFDVFVQRHGAIPPSSR